MTIRRLGFRDEDSILVYREHGTRRPGKEKRKGSKALSSKTAGWMRRETTIRGVGYFCWKKGKGNLQHRGPSGKSSLGRGKVQLDKGGKRKNLERMSEPE